MTNHKWNKKKISNKKSVTKELGWPLNCPSYLLNWYLSCFFPNRSKLFSFLFIMRARKWYFVSVLCADWRWQLVTLSSGCSQGRKQKFLTLAILSKSIPNYFLKAKPWIYIVALMFLDWFIRFVTLQLQSLS